MRTNGGGHSGFPDGHRGGNTATTRLPETGTYTIRVYQMGNDASAGKTTGYTLDLSIQ